MSERYEKAPASVGALDEAGAETAAVVGTFSKKQLITERGKKQGKVERLLRHGRENAIVATELMRLAGMNESKQLRNAISAERKAGALILASCHRGCCGYYLPNTDPEKAQAELADHINTIERRAKNSFAILKPARDALRQIVGQFEIKAVESEE